MITLIGTGHVFDLSSSLLRIFDEKNPEVLCVELDEQRYNALTMKTSNPERYKENSRNLPVIYKLLAKFQESMAQKYGVTAGEEMLTAINYAQSHQLPIEFIDMNAQVLFTKMLKSMKFSERVKLFFTGIGGFFVSKSRVEKELNKFENNLEKYIAEIGKNFPTIKRVLIDERNEFMVQRLVDVSQRFNKIMALVGDGHIPGISRLLNDKRLVFETIRLSELRSQKESGYDPSTASFNISYKEP
ncbi:MAG: TraB domain-containing protein [Candidatus Thermoplasmatota archaeon]|nr:TraB domain-containing protein [Candidatus Thermoplasmatota archaeon]